MQSRRLVHRLKARKKDHPVRKELALHPRILEITPELASNWYWNTRTLEKDTGRFFNRSIILAQVESVVELITRGEFPESEDPIALGATEWGWVICNGQHRLCAIALAKKSVRTRALFCKSPFEYPWEPEEVIQEPRWLNGGEDLNG